MSPVTSSPCAGVLSEPSSAGLASGTLWETANVAASTTPCTAVNAAAPHWYFECPLRLAVLFGHPCPGVAAAGGRAPADWAGADQSPAACASWRTLIARHGLTGPRMTAGRIPAF